MPCKYSRGIHIVVLYPFLLAVFCSVDPEMAGSAGEQRISPNDRRIRYQGRVDDSNPLRPKLIWPGTSMLLKIRGDAVSLKLREEGASYYSVFLDGDTIPCKVIKCAAGDSLYTLVKDLSFGIHTVELFKRTEAHIGTSEILEIELGHNAILLEPPAQNRPLIEFYGNSITCGTGNSAPVGNTDYNPQDQDNFHAFGAITSRILDVRYVCIAVSGIGLLVSGGLAGELTMPQVHARLNPLDSTIWDYRWIPDAIVINLMQNDKFLLSGDSGEVQKNVIGEYKRFINALREKYPISPIFCTLGPMNAVAVDSEWPDYLRRAVTELREEGDDGLYEHIFGYSGGPKHPRIPQHRQMAEELAREMSAVLGKEI